MEFNIFPFVIEAFGCNTKIYKDIDRLYQERKYDFYKAAKDDDLYRHPIVTEGALLQEEYCKKALGILLVATNPDQPEQDRTELNNAIFDIIRKGWTYAYLFVANKQEVDLYLFMKNTIRKAGGVDKVSDDWLNTQLLIVYFLALSSGKPIVANEWSETFQKVLLDRWQHYRDDEPTRISLNSAPKERISEVQELKRQIYIEYGRIVNYAGMYGILNDRAESMAMLYDYDNLSCESVFNTVDFTEKNVEEILLAYLSRHDGNNIEKAADFLCDAMYVRYMIKAYKEVKQRYFKNNKETTYIELEGLEKRLSASEQETLRLENLLKESRAMINDLERENARLKVELSEEKKSRHELNSLREFLFSLDQQEAFKKVDTYDIEELNKYKAIVIGGHEKWQARMKEVLPNFVFINPDNINFDLRLLDSMDAVFIYTNYLSHKIYYRVMSGISGKDIKVGYINQSNEKMVLQDIAKVFIGKLPIS